MTSKPAGMLVAFIDFAKAHDKIDRVKLWSCLQCVSEQQVSTVSTCSV